jgi:hypothetical protein
VSVVKAALFLLGVVWSIWLGERILASQDVPRAERWLSSLPGSPASSRPALSGGRQSSVSSSAATEAEMSGASSSTGQSTSAIRARSRANYWVNLFG